MQWNTLPKKLQKELFEKASSKGDLPQTAALRGQLARFLHKHKDDEAESSAQRVEREVAPSAVTRRDVLDTRSTPEPSCDARG